MKYIQALIGITVGVIELIGIFLVGITQLVMALLAGIAGIISMLPLIAIVLFFFFACAILS